MRDEKRCPHGQSDLEKCSVCPKEWYQVEAIEEYLCRFGALAVYERNLIVLAWKAGFEYAGETWLERH